MAPACVKTRRSPAGPVRRGRPEPVTAAAFAAGPGVEGLVPGVPGVRGVLRRRLPSLPLVHRREGSLTRRPIGP